MPITVIPMFPYPSGHLHMGHARNYAIADAIAQHYRRQGQAVHCPIGWDAYGLPAENAAREHGIDPRVWTDCNIAHMRDQLNALGLHFARDEELATHDPQYVARGQAIFLRLMRAGWIERRSGEVWWDPVDETVLANEQVVDGRGWRSGAVVERRTLRMLFGKVNRWAQNLSEGLDALDWPEAAKNPQRAWIGWDPESQTARQYDWCLSRQRSWGTPVPLIDCPRCGEVLADEAQLPLPNLSTRPTDAERTIDCPQCHGPALRSTETLDTFWDSSFYTLMYPQVRQGQLPAFVPGQPIVPGGGQAVDHYIGGLEHATMHLLYARWFMRGLRAIGEDVPVEPFRRLIGQGMVCAPAFRTGSTPETPARWVPAREVTETPDGPVWQGQSVEPVGAVKMSKSKHNGVDPGEAVVRFGADAVRFAVLFAAPYAQDMPWTDALVRTAQRHGERLRACAEAVAACPPWTGAEPPEAQTLRAQTVQAYEGGVGINGLLGQALGVMRLAQQQAHQGQAIARPLLSAVLDAWFPVAPSTVRALGESLGWAPAPIAVKAPPVARIAVQIDGVTRGSVPACDDPAVVWAAFQAAYPEQAARLAEGPVDQVWVPGRLFNALSKPRSRSQR